MLLAGDFGRAETSGAEVRREQPSMRWQVTLVRAETSGAEVNRNSRHVPTSEVTFVRAETSGAEVRLEQPRHVLAR